jgi:outer membrane protein TolC
LLLRRPDLRAAATRLIAADERLAGAEADLLPRLSLTASGGTRSDALRNLTDPDFLVWTLIGNLTQPLFEGGRRLAVVDEREARVRELAASWATAAITALREVEDALAASDAQRDTLPRMQTSAEESQAVVRLLQERYAAGLGDGLTLLREQRTALSRRIELLNLRLDQLLTRIDLHQALGGDVVANQRSVEDDAITRDREVKP